jgi:MarR family transcriptional regulator, 2-MHQ and catechol-resistance regulon repressor
MGLEGSDPRWHAWYAQAALHTRLLEKVGGEMERRTGLPAAWFEVLGHLMKCDTRMNELADHLVLSRGGATRLVARMEEAGLVTREIPPTDRRATFAVITDAGRKALEEALPVHLELVEEEWGRYLEPGEAETLIAVAERIGAAHGWVREPEAEGDAAPAA